MKLAATVLIPVLALALACSSPEPEPSIYTAVPRPPVPTETMQIQTTLPQDPISPTITPQGVVRFKFPGWVEDAPGLALAILNADIIAKARLISIDWETSDQGDWGHFAHLVYRFEALEYLKGHGSDELIVRLSSGPNYSDYPDVFGESRTEEEARELASGWLSSLHPIHRSVRDSVILLRHSGQEGLHEFLIADDGTGHHGHPIIGETWLIPENIPIYLHNFAGANPTPISIIELDAHIKYLERLSGSEYRKCVLSTLLYRDRVKRQHLGDYERLALPGAPTPAPFPQHHAEARSGSAASVYRLQRPPIETPRFSDYWLEGRHKDLFAFRVYSESYGYYEEVHPVRELRGARYSVTFSQYHQSLPCEDLAEENVDTWWAAWDAVESTVTVTRDDNVLHEAFFDPVALDSAIGADSSGGRIYPASFRLDDFTRVTIAGLHWDSGAVAMKLKLDGPSMPSGSIRVNVPHGPLLAFNFPERLQTGEDGHAVISWGYCETPWSAGDLLLLEILDAPYRFDDNQEECLTPAQP